MPIKELKEQCECMGSFAETFNCLRKISVGDDPKQNDDYVKRVHALIHRTLRSC